MKSFTALLLTFSTLLLAINAAPTTDWPVFAKLSDFKSRLHIFQTYANAAYPNKHHLIPLYDYLASGGLVQHPTDMSYVSVAEAVSHLGQGSVYQQEAVVRPAMSALIERHLKGAEKAGFKAEDHLLDEVRGLSDGRPLKTGGAFATTHRPLTWDEAEEVKRKWDAVGASSSGGGRMHGVPWGK
ncbi:uncharacterized protein UBRO2_03701 [Ustilago bromivora]|uniref:Uncharacterized protein n=1 Tax=Ustilago bromivora TaxID=307758 RepID=A0A8H8TTD9_9BASI|nr:uncharacterized protein UBRO2_03701 [Ustilago bromivora]